jgi:hypothetical protein
MLRAMDGQPILIQKQRMSGVLVEEQVRPRMDDAEGEGKCENRL